MSYWSELAKLTARNVFGPLVSYWIVVVCHARAWIGHMYVSPFNFLSIHYSDFSIIAALVLEAESPQEPCCVCAQNFFNSKWKMLHLGLCIGWFILIHSATLLSCNPLLREKSKRQWVQDLWLSFGAAMQTIFVPILLESLYIIFNKKYIYCWPVEVWRESFVTQMERRFVLKARVTIWPTAVRAIDTLRVMSPCMMHLQIKWGF